VYLKIQKIVNAAVIIAVFTLNYLVIFSVYFFIKNMERKITNKTERQPFITLIFY